MWLPQYYLLVFVYTHQVREEESSVNGLIVFLASIVMAMATVCFEVCLTSYLTPK